MKVHPPCIERNLRCTLAWKVHLGMKILPDWPYSQIIARRSAGKLAAENTLASFCPGATHDDQAFEFNVMLSADDKNIPQSIPLPDAILGRSDVLSLGELTQLDAGSWHRPASAGEPIATLASVARYTGAQRVSVNIEIKPSPGREWRTGAAVAIEVQRLWRAAKIAPLISSMSEEALRAAREFVPGLPRALLFDTLPRDWLLRLEALGCTALGANHKFLTQEIIEKAHAAGFRVLCYTVNDPARAQQLLDWGVDSMITDAADHVSPQVQ